MNIKIMLQEIKKYSIIFIISIFFTLIFFEIYVSYKNELFPSYRWQNNNIMDIKMEECQKKKNIGVFGDSFVEYYGDKKTNIVKILDKKILDYNVCNFGLSGTDINHYIDRFLYAIKNDVKMDKVLFYIYEGNDFADFRYTKLEKITYNSEKKLDRELTPIRKFIKSTYSLNIIYREIIKKLFYKNKINKNFVKEIYLQNKYYEVSLEDALYRMIETPDKYKKLFSSDILNINFYKLALRNPNYFKEIFNPGDKKYALQKDIAFKHINFINNICKNNNIECHIIIIPNDQFLFAQSKKKYSNVFRFNYQQEFGKSKIVTDILKKYDNAVYPVNIFEYEDYIENDLHLTGDGNKKLANFTYKNLIGIN